MRIERGIIRGFDPGSWRASIELVGAPAALLAGVPVAGDLGPELLALGSQVWVCLSGEGNPADGAVLVPYGAAPAPWVTSRLWKPTLVTAERTSSLLCSSTSFVTVPGLSLPVTLEVPGSVLLLLAATGSATAAGISYTLAFYHDDSHESTQLSPIETAGGSGAPANENWTLTWLALQTAIAAGEHTFTLRHRVTSGQATLQRARVLALAMAS